MMTTMTNRKRKPRTVDPPSNDELLTHLLKEARVRKADIAQRQRDLVKLNGLIRSLKKINQREDNAHPTTDTSNP